MKDNQTENKTTPKRIGRIAIIMCVSILALSILLWPLLTLVPSSNRKVPSLEELVASNQSTPIPTPTEESIPEKNYIFLDGIFVGAYENGIWNSNHDYAASNIKNIRSFNTDEITGNPVYMFTKTSFLGQNSIYSLPLEDTKKLAENEAVEENEEVNPEAESDRNEQTEENPPLSPPSPEPVFIKIDDPVLKSKIPAGVSVDRNIIPEQISYDVIITASHVATTREFLNSKGITDSEVNIFNVISVDINHDGILEEIIVAGTKLGTDNFPIVTQNDVSSPAGRAIYSTILLVKNGYTAPIYFKNTKITDLSFSNEGSTQYDKKDAFSLDLIGIYDLNFDNNAEVSIQEFRTNSRTIEVYSLDSTERYNMVLHGHFTW